LNLLFELRGDDNRLRELDEDNLDRDEDSLDLDDERFDDELFCVFDRGGAAFPPV
jgi:hypothetical protein